MDIDYALLFSSMPTPYLVLTPDLVIVEANDAYLAAVGRSREDLVGKPLFEAFPPTPDALDEHGVPRIQVSFERARDTGKPDTMPVQRYPILDATTGGLVERFWSLISVPVLDETGQVVWLLQRTEDVTDFVRERERGDAVQQQSQAWRDRVEQVESNLYARAQELDAALEAKELASRQLAALAGVALQLTGASTIEHLTRVIFGSGRPTLGADGGGVGVRDDDRGVLRLRTAALGDHVQNQYGEVPLDGPLPASVAARTGQMVLLPDTDAGLALTPEMAAVYEATSNLSWVSLPLKAGDKLLGSLTVGWKDPRAFTDADLELLQAFAAQCAQVLDRIQVREAERRAARQTKRMSEALQRSLLTAPSHAARLELAVRYQPAAQEAQVGGDWYDAFRTADGSTTLVIGDVAGHDRDAAAAMAQVRNVLRGVAQTLGEPPAAVLRGLDRALRGLEVQALATAVLCQVQPLAAAEEGGPGVSLRWSNAGHLPPVLVHSDGTAVLLTGEPDLVLGLDPEFPRHDHQMILEPGSTLVLYTDGLVERRNESIDDSVEALRGLIEELGTLGPEEMCDALLERLAADAEDDVALLVLRPESG